MVYIYIHFFSFFFWQILPQKNGEMNGDRKGGPPNQMEERKVILTGSAESQWKVCYHTTLILQNFGAAVIV
jgi:hypothetical protein